MKYRKVHITSLGCPKNLVDSEVMGALLSRSGYHVLPRDEEADIIVINTCAFILPAKEESIHEILKAAELRKGKEKALYLVVTGCLPQRYGNTLEQELPEVDLFLGVGEIPNIVSHLDRITARGPQGHRSVIGKPSFLMDAKYQRLLSTPFHTAYLKIAEWCSHRCSYFIIPSLRGNARSRKIDDILTEAEILARGGVKEIIITAQDTTAYGRDLNKGKSSLSHLLKNLSLIQGIEWIRLLYTNPVGITEHLLATMRDEEKICNYIDMPIQHIDNGILKAMNRKGGDSLIRRTIERVRATIPHVTLRTSLIVGFPGETPTIFKRLVAFIREARFDHLGVFTYSREESTKAASFSSQVPEKQKEFRRHVLMREQASVSLAINRSLIGSTQEVLIEGKSASSEFPLRGRCRRQAPDIDGITFVKGGNVVAGDIVLCTIVAAVHYDLYAERIVS